MKFMIEQIALCPVDPEAAKELLNAIGAEGSWAEDHVVADGKVFGRKGRNEADLSFNYDMLGEARELEILSYTSGENWIANREGLTPARVSHLGMHCGKDELAKWKRFFARRGISIAQEVKTQSHTNPHIAGKRWYHYVIFDTYDILSVDLKFIVRRSEK